MPEGRRLLKRHLTIGAVVAFCLAGAGVTFGAGGPSTEPQRSGVLAADAIPTPPATTERVSVGADGRQGNDGSGGVSAVYEAMNPDQAMSADGRWVAFAATATNLIPGENHPAGGIFVRDRQSGTTFAIPWIGGGVFPANARAAEPVISGDGAVVAFTAVVSTGGTGAILAPATAPYVLAWDRGTNITEAVSVDAQGAPTPGYQPSISADGRYVAYTRWFIDKTPPVLTNLAANPTRIGGCSGPNATTITVTATDPDDPVASVTLFFTPPSGTTISQQMTAAGGNVWQSTITRDPNWFTGQISYRVQGVDSHGNTSAVLFPSTSNQLFNDPCIL